METDEYVKMKLNIDYNQNLIPVDCGINHLEVWQQPAFTITSEDQRCRRAQHLLPCDSVVNHTGVVANIWGLHFGDVQASSLLRDESTTVLLDKMWVFIENPCKCQFWRRKEDNST